MGGYIKIDRKILEWEWYKNLNTCRLFFHILLKANWKDGKFEGMEVPRGSFVSSISGLSEETGLTIREVRTAIEHLKATGELTSKAYSKFTLFTVNNYCLYQGDDKVPDKRATNERQANDKRTTTIEEKKEIKKDRKEQEGETATQRILLGDRFSEFCELYPKKFSNILVVNGEYTYLLQTTPELSEDSLIAAVKNYAESCRIQKTKERFIKNPDNWMKDSTWISYLPENYKKPEGEKPKNKFNQFPQNDYDFEELEKKLLSNNGGCNHEL